LLNHLECDLAAALPNQEKQYIRGSTPNQRNI